MNTDTPTENKKSWLQVFIGITGGIIGIIGFFLLGYSAFILLNKTESQKISEFLPAENLQFFLHHTSTIENTSISETLERSFPNLLPKNGIFAVYVFPEQDNIPMFFRIESEKKDTPYPQDLYCETIHSYWICANPEQKSGVITLVDSIKNNASPLSLQKEFLEMQNSIASHQQTTEKKESDVIFFGNTQFFIEQSWEKFQFLFPLETKESILTLLTFAQENSPYIAGSISDSNFLIMLEKKQKGEIFKTPLSKYNFSSDFLSPETDRYLLIKKPEIIWNTFFPLFEKKSLDTSFITQSSLEKYFESSLVKKTIHLDFTTDVLPLFAGDVLWAEEKNLSSVFYSLPKESITQELFSRFAEEVENIAISSVPKKVSHTLQDGTTIYEVFSNEENMKEEKKSDDTGEQIIFTNTNPETDGQYTIGITRKDTFFMISESKKFLDHFWDLSNPGSNFTFSNKKNTFLSFGYQKRPEENPPIRSIEMSGSETSSHIIFSGNVVWNEAFSIQKTKASTEKEIRLTTPENSEKN